jgi:hypothetical protein
MGYMGYNMGYTMRHGIQQQWITRRDIFRNDVIIVSIGSVGSSDVLIGLNGVVAATIPYGTEDTPLVVRVGN